MATTEITIRVNDDAAQAYRNSSGNERRRLDALLSLRLEEATKSPASLEQVIERIGRKARERGLDEATLKELLQE